MVTNLGFLYLKLLIETMITTAWSVEELAVVNRFRSTSPLEPPHTADNLPMLAQVSSRECRATRVNQLKEAH